MKLKNVVMMLIASVCVISCAPDVEVSNHYYSDGKDSTVITRGTGLIVNVGDSKYGTRSVITDEAVTPSSLKDYKIGLYNESWYDYSNEVSLGTSRGYLFGTADVENPYGNSWSVSNSITDGSLTLTADAMTSDAITGYYNPVPVMFWGNYSIKTNTEEKDSYDSSDTSWQDNVVNSTTKTAAISKSIQYATSVFKPVIKVSDKIKVYSDAGVTIKEISKDELPFTVQYIYLESSKSVTYTEDFKYSPSTEHVTYKYCLKENGIFGKVNNGSDKFDSWENNYTNLTVLPTNSTETKVILVCKYFGSNSKFYMYDSKAKNYIAVPNGSTFYVYGKLTSSDKNSVSNDTNPDCPKDGSAGVFIPDVRTTANIVIDAFAVADGGEDKGNGKGDDDPVIINPDASTIVTKALFDIDVNYGDMNLDWLMSK